jgi:hypothetical protein
VGAGALVVDLAGLWIAEGRFVQPAESRDAAHAAWYSEAREMRGVRVEAGVAMVGWREGAPFVHAHVLWDGGRQMGHLLNDSVGVGAGVLRGVAFDGGRFVQRADAETGFALFRAEGGGSAGDAAILTVRPHEDVGRVVAAVVAGFGWDGAEVMGLGSLIGARFEAGPGMADPISEMLVLPGARVGEMGVAVVDLSQRVFAGVLAEGGGEVCVTAELLLRRTPRIGS